MGAENPSKEWRAVHIGFEGDGLKIGGVDIWKQDWRRVKMNPLRLPHPAYPQQTHSYEVYDAGGETQIVRFAASELSNGVWGFYVPAQN
ncbi:MAG TPA: hypothetical protein VMH86_14910 [Rhizomicrobium sp.]|nr:hypothetical protein [Rhizomicrobium sp.]